MAWEPLVSRTNNTVIPLILAGPILRRTESLSVTVWLALKENCSNIILHIYEGFADKNDTSVKVEILRGYGYTKQVGDHIHIVTITANILIGSQQLIPGETYCYNIEFGNGRWLDTANIFNASGNLNNTNNSPSINMEVGLCYNNSTLPTFALPPSDLSNLHIIHSSCRKPHGGIAHSGEKDALALADIIIEESYSDPNTRPHQFYHTGDQIYADDVADSLLFMLHDASQFLLGWTEDLPNVDNSLDTEWPDDLKPGHRWDTLQRLTAFSVDQSGSNHLMRLGEFYCMYLFVWSDVLWPKREEDMPSFSSVYPGVGETHNVTYKVEESPSSSRSYSRVEKTPQKISYDSKKALLLNFSSTLMQVRRVLANVPSYMMCDDHEITDDWFISYDWVRLVYGYDKSTGVYPPSNVDNLACRIIQNGLSAYNLFQNWGNKPDQYNILGSPENVILTSLTNIHIERGDNSASWNILKGKLLPPLESDGVNIEGTPLLKLGNSGMPDYSFSIVFDNYILIALNTRTERSFVTHEDSLSRTFYGPMLINYDAIKRQVTNKREGLPKSVQVAMVLCPAPVFGHAFVEGVLQHGAFKVQRKLGWEQPPVALRAYPKEYWDESNDREAWSFNEENMERLLKELSLFERIVLYSGDVHYGFSISIRYNNHRPASIIPGTNISYPTIANFVQLVASSLKNSTVDLPQSTFLNGRAKFRSMEGKIFHYAGWETSTPQVHTIEKYISVFPSGYRYTVPGPKAKFVVSEIGYNNVGIPDYDIDYSDIDNDPPHWTYDVGFGLDSRSYLDRINYNNSNLPGYNVNTSSSNFFERARYNLLYHFYLGQDTAVGLNQIGQVKFEWGGIILVKHHFWYRVNKNVNPGPLTVHSLPIL